MEVDSLETKKRNPFISGVLSLFFTGIGQIYNGQLKKGIIFYFIQLLLPVVLLSTQLRYSYPGLVTTFIIIAIYRMLITVEAVATSISLKEIRLKKYNKWYFYLVFILLGFIITATFCLHNYTREKIIGLKPYYIPSISMSPTVHNKDHFMVDLKYFKKNKPQRGDIIVFDFPLNPERKFLKRIIALEGDKVEVKEGSIFVNEKDIANLYNLQGKKAGISNGTKLGPLVVPPGKYFVVGDNYNNSEDSRHWGYIDMKDIKGKVYYVFYPIGRDIK